MDLIELLKSAPLWTDDDGTIYAAKPWECSADAIIVSPAPDTIEDIERLGKTYSYFLESFIARDFLEDYAASAEGKEASEREKCQRVIKYAVDDA